jgi:hypothetical protein
MERWLLAVVAAGCGGGDGDGSPAPADAPDAPSAHVLYLDFDGEVVTRGVGDAEASRSSIIPRATTIPPYGRPQLRAEIVSETQRILAPYDIAVVDERPTGGDYIMVVFGGSSELLGFPADHASFGIVTCGMVTDDIVFVFDLFMNVNNIVNQVISLEGLTGRVPESARLGDCMCFTAPSCAMRLDNPCTIGGPGTPMWSGNACESGATFDVDARFRAAFGER